MIDFDKKHISQFTGGSALVLVIYFMISGGTVVNANQDIEIRLLDNEKKDGIRDKNIALNTQAVDHFKEQYQELQRETKRELEIMNRLLFQLCQGMAKETGNTCTI